MHGFFNLTGRQLARDQTKRTALVLVVPLTLAIAWIAWLLLARVSIYADTNQARVEVAQAVYSVQAPVPGRVMESHLDLGQEVEPGSLLVVLGSDPQKLRVEQTEMQQATLQTQFEDQQRELGEEQRASAAERSAGQILVQQAKANLAEAEEAVRLSQEELTRKTELEKQGLTAQIELLRAASDHKRKEIELESFRTTVARVKHEQAIHAEERQAHIEEIKAEIDHTQGELATSRNAQQGLQDELGWHRIVASVRGRLDEVVNIKAGSYVEQGQQIAVIVPDGQFRIVSYFEPSSVIGRVKPGQSAHLRLSGFPWAEYGSVTAFVTSVGTEVRDGRVRVELNPQPNPRLPLQHGLPGTLEIQIERISPAVFLLRKAGLYLAKPASSPVAAQ
jgi:multidrug resistance efflux pump